MFPLFVKNVGKFFNLPAARAAIEQKIQPAIATSLSSMTKPQWVQSVGEYLKQNTTSVVTLISSLSLVTDVVQLLGEDANKDDAAELEEIKKLVGTSGSVPVKVGQCSTNPELLTQKIHDARRRVDISASALGMTRKEFCEWFPTFAMISPEDITLASI